MENTYIEYLYPGLMFSDTSAEKVANRDIPQKLPDSCFGFRFFDKTEVETTGGEKLQGQPRNHSNWYYRHGEVMNLKQVQKKHPEKHILISNMQNNKIAKVLFTKFGQAIPLDKDDVVLDVK